jgi:predicted SnoaL-like aldol condensation-catalyzing enzyme
MTKKEIATAFEQMIVTGHIRVAYENYVSSDFIHHNPYFKGNRESLLIGMEQNQEKFANKEYKVLRALEDEDLVVIHSRIKLSAEMPEMSVVHIYRFDDGKIVEEWDLSLIATADSPNENGIF